ncbi:hypothetical protein JYU34_006694 [Plutella xylostella]|uniref:Uncharacterized protein n=2 Tax=Plutella xylostella TaxID=51655 RepID=A0ABQ7QSQ0_PLUXY|nr:hypothetical protein JYU34_006694 [Plutella xylostella]
MVGINGSSVPRRLFLCKCRPPRSGDAGSGKCLKCASIRHATDHTASVKTLLPVRALSVRSHLS